MNPVVNNLEEAQAIFQANPGGVIVFCRHENSGSHLDNAKSLEEAEKFYKQFEDKPKRKLPFAVLTVGCFDMLHEGHVNLLRKMEEASEGEKFRAYNVFIIIHDDLSIFENKGRFPVQDHVQRSENLRKLGYQKITYCYNADPTTELMILLTELRRMKEAGEIEGIIYMRGDDWGDFPGKKYLDQEGIEIRFIKYTKGVSSTQRHDELNKGYEA